MPKVLSNYNLFCLNTEDHHKKQAGCQILYLNNIEQNIEKIIDDCQKTSQTLNPLNADESKDKRASEIESNDKKSLLTQMLHKSQFLQSQTQDEQSPKKNRKRPMSQFNTVAESNRRLLKQIDFSNYRLEGLNPKKVKKG